MVTATRSTTKAKHGLESRTALLQKAHQRPQKNPHQPAVLPLTSGGPSGARRCRLRRLRNSILGRNPSFPGKIIIPSDIDARREDSTRVQDVEQALQEGTAQVFWVDGSDRGGFLGASVVWLDDTQLAYKSYQLGPSTGGNAADTELFALAAALGRAKKLVQQGRALRLVRVFSDALSILGSIRQGHCLTFGPLLAKKTALEGLYARAQWLKAHDVDIELIWVKGHAHSEGNNLADKIAGQATSDQAVSPNTVEPPGASTLGDVPEIWRSMGQDWVEEFLSRANHKQVILQRKTAKKMKKMHKYASKHPKTAESAQQRLNPGHSNGMLAALGAFSKVANHTNSVDQTVRRSSDEVIDLTGSPPPEEPPIDEITRLRNEQQTLLAPLSKCGTGAYEPDRITATPHNSLLAPKRNDTANIIKQAVTLDNKIRAYQERLDTVETLQQKEKQNQKRLKAEWERAKALKASTTVMTPKTFLFEVSLSESVTIIDLTASDDEVDERQEA